MHRSRFAAALASTLASTLLAGALLAAALLLAAAPALAQAPPRHRHSTTKEDNRFGDGYEERYDPTKRLSIEPTMKRKSPSKTTAYQAPAKPKLLTGGNPQIPKGDGEAPVQAYLAAMPGWKQAVGRQLDALIVQNVPNLRKAVRWNTPFYGHATGWFIAFNCTKNYIKVTFLEGALLHPSPPVASKHKAVRYFHINENDDLDEQTLISWVHQASRLPGDPFF